MTPSETLQCCCFVQLVENSFAEDRWEVAISELNENTLT